MTSHPNRSSCLDYAVSIANEIADLVTRNVAVHSDEAIWRIQAAVEILNAAARLYDGSLTSPAWRRLSDRRDTLRQMAAGQKRIALAHS